MKAYPAYRASRLSWAGQVPQHWQEKRARFLFRVIDERSEAGSEELLSVSHLTGVTPRSEKNVTMFMAESYEGHKLCKPGDVVINSLWAWMAALGVSRHRGIVSAAYGVYRQQDERNFNPRFLDYLLRTKGYAGEYFCRSRGVWSSRLLLTPFDFFDISILQPPRVEQDAIVAFLEGKQREMDAFIANKQRTIALLQEQKAALINRAVTRGLDPDAPLKPSGVDWLDDIPASWNLLRIKWFADYVTSGSRGWAAYYADEGPVFLRIGNVSNKSIRLKLEDLQRVKPPSGAEGSRTKVSPGDLLISITALIGAVGVVPDDFEEAYVNQHIALVRPNADMKCRDWFAYFLLSQAGQKQFQLLVNGGTKEGLSLDDVRNLWVAVPPVAEQHRITRHITEREQQFASAIAQARREIAMMQEYRTALIAEAVTGRIDVRSQPSDGLATLTDTLAPAGFYASDYFGTSTGETPPRMLSAG